MASQSNKTSPKKPKLVRDSFTIPKTEFAAIDQLKTRAIALGSSVKKSELLRAGLMVLQGLNDAAYKAAQEVYSELSAKNANWKKIYEDYSAFRREQNQWFRFAEGGFDSYMQSQKL